MLYKNFMDGEWVAARDGATDAIPDPSTGETIDPDIGRTPGAEGGAG
jgi:hypothetical protein